MSQDHRDVSPLATDVAVAFGAETIVVLAIIVCIILSCLSGLNILPPKVDQS